MRFQILGTKLGMTQLYDGNVLVPVTVIKANPCVITQIKTMETDGYCAIQVGYGAQKEHRFNKPMKGHFAKAGVTPTRHLREVRMGKDESTDLKVGDEVKAADGFIEGDFVDVTGTSKGKGFQGVMKKYNFKGFISTHGSHEYFRHGGSIGCRLTPGRVFKGKKMPGQMGNARVTAMNLVLHRIDSDKNLIFVKGAVPGCKGGLVTVSMAMKKSSRK